MITLLVEATSGHYGTPGQVNMGGTAFTFPVPSPSTIQGMLEAFTGSRSGSFRGRFAYGRVREPGGQGQLYLKRHTWGSVGVKRRFSDGTEIKRDNEILRPVFVEYLFDVSYCIQVEGPWEDKIRAALDGDVSPYGCLYLGTSEDIVHWIGEMQEPTDFVEWVVPGKRLRLITQSGRGYNTINAKWDTYDLKTGKPEWVLEVSNEVV